MKKQGKETYPLGLGRAKFDIRFITRNIVTRKATIIIARLMLPKGERNIPLLETLDMVLLFLLQGNFNPLGLGGGTTNNTRNRGRTGVV